MAAGGAEKGHVEAMWPDDNREGGASVKGFGGCRWGGERARGSHVARLTIDKEGIQHLVVLDPGKEGVWDEKYGEEGTLEYGASLEQGPRDTMEDFITVVPRARCGFLFAGARCRE